MKKQAKTVSKPWGSEAWLEVNDKYAVKLLQFNKGAQCSLQYHETKTETMYITKGRFEFTLGEENFLAGPGDIVHVPPKTRHRLKALEDSELFEVSTPELDDIVRLEDDFGRA